MKLRRCDSCGIYTLRSVCPKCGQATTNPHPPKFSPQDKYGVWRRIAKMKATNKSQK